MWWTTKNIRDLRCASDEEDVTIHVCVTCDGSRCVTERWTAQRVAQVQPNHHEDELSREIHLVDRDMRDSLSFRSIRSKIDTIGQSHLKSTARSWARSGCTRTGSLHLQLGHQELENAHDRV